MEGWKDGQKDRQTLFHRTPPANARGPKNSEKFHHAIRPRKSFKLIGQPST